MGSIEQQECIICFENMSDYSVAILSCGHKFHLHCIQGWKNTQGKSSNYTHLCSYCRNTNVEIINIIDGTKKDPKAISPKKKNSNSSLLEPPRAHLYERRRQSVDALQIFHYNDEYESAYCCCTIL